jgi:hypothetical protein
MNIRSLTTAPRLLRKSRAYHYVSSTNSVAHTASNEFRLRSVALVVLSALVCVLVLHASPASAVGAHERILESAPFSQPLSFSHPTGVAVDQETGNVFVADNGADAVDIFGAEGGTPAGGVPAQITGIEFAAEEPQAVAVDNACYYQKLSGSACEAADPANGDVYVTEQEGHAVSRFKFESKTKKYKKEAFYKVLSSELQGVAVDTDGNVYIANHTETPILVFNPSGTEVGKIEQKKVAHPSHVAVGAPGVVYVSPAEGGIVIKLGVNSKYEIGLGQETVLESASGGDMAVDSHGTLYLDGDGTSISVYDSAGTLTEGFGSGDFAESQGVAVNDTSNNVYVSNVGEGNLEVFGPPGVAGGPWVTGTASNLTLTGATLSASVNPEGGAVSSCEFEYGTEENSLGQSVPCEQTSVQIGEGTGPVLLSAKVSGLQPGSPYFFRVGGVGVHGANHGGVKAFTTSPAVQGVQTGGASGITTTEATVEGSLEPDGAEVEYYFEYGRTSVSESKSTPQVITGLAGEKKSVTAALAGLTAATGYRYKLVAKNTLYAQLVSGVEKTFETLTASNGIAIETGEASEVLATSATVAGSLTPNTEKPEYDQTEYYFEYATATLNGSGSRTTPVTISQAEVEADPHSRALSANIAGLVEAAQATAYHYRLVARNALGTGYGAEKTFATQPVFSSLTTAEATNVGPLSATLHGTFKSSGEKETIYWLEYRTCEGSSCSSWTKTPELALSKAQIEAAETSSHDGGVSVEASVTGLQAGTLYSYRLAARNTSVTMDAGASSFTTGPQAPRVESEQASEVTAHSALLTASINPGNSATSSYPASYHFEYQRVGSSEVQSYAPAAVTGANGAVTIVPEAITGLAPESEYAYRLILENASGKVEGPQQTFTTATAPPPPQTGPSEGGSPSTHSPALSQPLSQPLLPVLVPTPLPKQLTPKPAPKPLTRAQKLAKALKACKKQPSKRRAGCEKQARKRYGPLAKKPKKPKKPSKAKKASGRS